MEEAPENSKELSHSAHANGMNELLYIVSECHKSSNNTPHTSKALMTTSY